MKAIKFDEEKVNRSIKAFYDQRDTYPYLICSEKTADFIKKSIEPRPFTAESITTNASSLTLGTVEIGKMLTGEIDVTKVVNNNNNNNNKPKDYGYFNGAKIMIDNALAFGEVLIVG